MQFVRLPQLLQRRGRGRSAHYEDIARGVFTKPVKIGPRAAGWPEHEVDQLIAAQIASFDEARMRCLVEQLHAARRSSAPELRPRRRSRPAM